MKTSEHWNYEADDEENVFDPLTVLLLVACVALTIALTRWVLWPLFVAWWT